MMMMIAKKKYILKDSFQICNIGPLFSDESVCWPHCGMIYVLVAQLVLYVPWFRTESRDAHHVVDQGSTFS